MFRTLLLANLCLAVLASVPGASRAETESKSNKSGQDRLIILKNMADGYLAEQRCGQKGEAEKSDKIRASDQTLSDAYNAMEGAVAQMQSNAEFEEVGKDRWCEAYRKKKK